jgi:hypothetical protein
MLAGAARPGRWRRASSRGRPGRCSSMRPPSPPRPPASASGARSWRTRRCARPHARPSPATRPSYVCLQACHLVPGPMRSSCALHYACHRLLAAQEPSLAPRRSNMSHTRAACPSRARRRVRRRPPGAAGKLRPGGVCAGGAGRGRRQPRPGRRRGGRRGALVQAARRLPLHRAGRRRRGRPGSRGCGLPRAVCRGCDAARGPAVGAQAWIDASAFQRGNALQSGHVSLACLLVCLTPRHLAFLQKVTGGLHDSVHMRGRDKAGVSHAGFRSSRSSNATAPSYEGMCLPATH